MAQALLYMFASAFITLLYLALISRVGQRSKDLPPGPPTLPIIGNLHQMPTKPEESGRQFEKWAREYGSVYSLIFGTQVWIILCKDWAVKDLLERRGAIYSSRPEAYLAQDVFSGGMRAFLMKDDEWFKRNRRLGRIYFNEKSSKIYTPYQDLENKAMLSGFLERPELFLYHIKRYTTSLTTQMIFGFRVPREDDPLPKKLFYLFDRFSEIALSPTATLLDTYPVLRYLPDLLVPGQRQARDFHKEESEIFLRLHIGMKKKVLEGQAPACFSRDLVRIQEEEGMSDERAAYTSGSLLQGGLGSTTETLVGFVKAMMLFPYVSKVAQAELDRVCGNRMPELDDAPELPYVRGCVKEALRWMPASPIGIPHALTRDDEYIGYRMPKGATVIYNVRAIHNDPERHENPRVFDPTRWAHDTQTEAQSATNADVSKRDHFMFGAGRRMCQGIHVAERSLFLAISRLLWAFDFQRPVDPVTGCEIPPSDADDLQGGMFVMPRPFQARILPRDGEKEVIIKKAWDEISESFLDGNLQWKRMPDGLS